MTYVHKPPVLIDRWCVYAVSKSDKSVIVYDPFLAPHMYMVTRKRARDMAKHMNSNETSKHLIVYRVKRVVITIAPKVIARIIRVKGVKCH